MVDNDQCCICLDCHPFDNCPDSRRCFPGVVYEELRWILQRLGSAEFNKKWAGGISPDRILL